MDIIGNMLTCPICGGTMTRREPTDDKKLVVNKDKTVRLHCKCGHTQDVVLNKTGLGDNHAPG
jgi:hypothetical protein